MARKPWKCDVCHRKASVELISDWKSRYCWKHFTVYLHEQYPYTPYTYDIRVRPSTKANIARLEDTIEGFFA